MDGSISMSDLMPVAISYPFTLDNYGRVATTTDQHKMYMDRILTLLSTIAGSRVMRPEYGINHSLGAFQAGGNWDAGLREAIYSALSQWLPGVRVGSVTVTKPGQDGISRIEVAVTLPDLSDHTVSVNTSYVTSNESMIG
jgi:phage baseplate assembly protein W